MQKAIVGAELKPNQVFTQWEMESIHAALQLVFGEDPILPHWEFPILIGASIEEGMEFLNNWPNVDIGADPEWFLIFGILGRLKGYPHKQNQRLYEATGLQKENLKILLDKLRPLEPKT